MRLASIARVCEIVSAFFGCEGLENVADSGAQGVDGSCRSISEEMFEFGKDLLDRVQVG